MIRLLASALGMAGLLAFPGIARADEPAEEEAAPKVEERTAESVNIHTADGNVIERIVMDGKVIFRVRKGPSAKGLVVGKDGKPVVHAKVHLAPIVISGEGEDGKSIVVHGSRVRLTGKDGNVIVFDSKGKLLAKADGEEDIDEVVEEDEVEIDELKQVLEALKEELKETLRHTKPKAKIVRGKAKRMLEGLDDMPWVKLVEAFGDGVKDVQVTVKLPDGTTHTLGGKGAPLDFLTGRHVLGDKALRRFRYEGTDHAKGLGAHRDLQHRVEQLEAQNRRMQHELELMRRRMNEMRGTRRAPKDSDAAHPTALALRALQGAARGGSSVDARLQRIESMLKRLVHQGDRSARRDVAPRGRPAKRPKAAPRKKAPKEIEDMLRHSRMRIEELRRLLEEKKAAVEKLETTK